MQVVDFKNWLNGLPSEFDDMEFVFRKVIESDTNEFQADDEYIVSGGIDVGNKVAFLCNMESHLLMEK